MSGLFDSDDEEMMETIKEALDELIQLGYVEVIGIDENGEWLYKATDAGIKFHKRNREK
jgi:hypothetical protein